MDPLTWLLWALALIVGSIALAVAVVTVMFVVALVKPTPPHVTYHLARALLDEKRKGN